jgi:hypothetical protein
MVRMDGGTSPKAADATGGVGVTRSAEIIRLGPRVAPQILLPSFGQGRLSTSYRLILSLKSRFASASLSGTGTVSVLAFGDLSQLS